MRAAVQSCAEFLWCNRWSQGVFPFRDALEPRVAEDCSFHALFGGEPLWEQPLEDAGPGPRRDPRRYRLRTRPRRSVFQRASSVADRARQNVPRTPRSSGGPPTLRPGSTSLGLHVYRRSIVHAASPPCRAAPPCRGRSAASSVPAGGLAANRGAAASLRVREGHVRVLKEALCDRSEGSGLLRRSLWESTKLRSAV